MMPKLVRFKVRKIVPKHKRIVKDREGKVVDYEEW
jgi:hypothetical protein